MASIQPPPTYALPLLEENDPHHPGQKISKFNPIWLKWFVDFAAVMTGFGGTVPTHNLLGGLQGGVANPAQFFHLSSADFTALTSGTVAHLNADATFTGTLLSSSPTKGVGYATGAGGAITQITSRATGVVLNTLSGAITLFSAAGSASWNTFTVSNTSVAATDTVRVCQQSGTDKYQIHVTNVSSHSFDVTFATTGGTTTEQPVFNFAVIKGVVA